MSKTPCECPVAGFCTRHRKMKVGRLHELCQTDQRYFDKWESEATGVPLSRKARAQLSARDPVQGPGTELHKLLAARGYSITAGCPCQDRIRKMNRWGVTECRKRIDEICSWLEKSACESKWTLRVALTLAPKTARERIRSLVLKAIEQADQKRIAMVVPNKPAWLGPARGKLFCQVLRDNGYSVDLIPINSDRKILVEQLSEYDLVCNHAMQANIIEEAAQKYPATKFVNINHSAIAHLERLGDSYIKIFAESLRLARELPNVWYGSQEPIDLGLTRAMWLPSPGVEQEPRDYRPPNTPANVVIAGRVDSIKNNLNHILACGMTRNRVRLILCTPENSALDAVIKQLGIDYHWRGHLPHSVWIEFLQTQADVVMCCSLAESFGFVASEAMSTGVPVVASTAIRFADPHLLTDHSDPRSIAEKIDTALEQYPERCRAAPIHAARALQTQQREYLARIERLTQPEHPNA